jgi:hypothetical protein
MAMLRMEGVIRSAHGSMVCVRIFHLLPLPTIDWIVEPHPSFNRVFWSYPRPWRMKYLGKFIDVENGKTPKVAWVTNNLPILALSIGYIASSRP